MANQIPKAQRTALYKLKDYRALLLLKNIIAILRMNCLSLILVTLFCRFSLSLYCRHVASFLKDKGGWGVGGGRLISKKSWQAKRKEGGWNLNFPNSSNVYPIPCGRGESSLVYPLLQFQRFVQYETTVNVISVLHVQCVLPRRCQM